MHQPTRTLCSLLLGVGMQQAALPRQRSDPDILKPVATPQTMDTPTEYRKGIAGTATGLTAAALLASLASSGKLRKGGEMKAVTDFFKNPIIPKSLLSKLPKERVFHAPSISEESAGFLSKKLSDGLPGQLSEELFGKLGLSKEKLTGLSADRLRDLSEKLLEISKDKRLTKISKQISEKLSKKLSVASGYLSHERDAAFLVFKNEQRNLAPLQKMKESVATKLKGVTGMHALGGAAATAALAAAYANRQSLSSFGSDVKKKATALWNRMLWKKEEEPSSADTPDAGAKEMPDQMTPGQLTSLADAD